MNRNRCMHLWRPCCAALLLGLLLLPSALRAQTKIPTTLDGWADRLTRFGKGIPQEKVYVHMDNNCYFLGDTIWFAAYTRRTDRDLPSGVSRLLYAELFNQDGYLVERKLIEMVGGRGSGCFALPDTLYSGYYELRAYTRWQLNWGQYEHPHSVKVEEEFQSLALAKEYYRDYDKLYSRVFPVYDKPRTPGDYAHDMTLRPLRRYFKDDEPEPKFQVALYPEGGRLVGGVPCRMAFEGVDQEGQTSRGRVVVRDKAGTEVAKGEAENRGRGVVEFTPQVGQKYEVTFYSDSVNRKGQPIVAKATIADIQADGVSVRLSQDAAQVQVRLDAAGAAAATQLGVTVMHQGVVERYWKMENGQWMADNAPATDARIETKTDSRQSSIFNLQSSAFQPGVNQFTVFDAAGRIYADRLFFVLSDAQLQPTLAVSGAGQKYEPFSRILLNVKAQTGVPSGTPISLSVRDATYTDPVYDSGNILTEMLLASEIKGFVPNPEYFFEANDDVHRRALDLLMLTQGWRRFEWREMATPGVFELTHPNEQTQVLDGSVREYYALRKENTVDMMVMAEHMAFMGANEEGIRDELQMTFGAHADLSFLDTESWQQTMDRIGAADVEIEESSETTTDPTTEPSGSSDAAVTANTVDAPTWLDPSQQNIGMSPFQGFRFNPSRAFVSTGSTLSRSRSSNQSQRVYYGGVSTPQTSQNTDRPSWQRLLRDETRLKREVLVHAFFQQPGSEGVVGEMTTDKGRFRITVPHFYGECYFHLAASDTTKWRKGQRHQWVVVNDDEEDEFQEFYVRLSFPYPRFIKPYSWYQCHLAPLASESLAQDRQDGFALDRNLKEVVIRSKHGGLRKFDPSKPAFVVDAYEALNAAIDAGLNTGRFNGSGQFVSNVARTYIGDMNMERRYEVETRHDGRNSTSNETTGQKDFYNYLYNLDKVYVYTDYSPRREGSTRFEQANQPKVTVDLRKNPDGGKNATFRDRYLILKGFAGEDDFYHPNYAGRKPAAEGVKDYRRTLYWNPDLQLDADGQATVSFYNNGKETYIEVSAEGQGNDGTLLWSGQ